MFTMEDLFGAGSNTPPDPIIEAPPNPIAVFDAAWFRSRPVPVQWMMEKASLTLRIKDAQRLYQRYAIDTQIDVYQYPPYETMQARQAAGIAQVEGYRLYPTEPVKHIQTVTEPEALFPVQRSFTISDYFSTVRRLNQAGIITGNEDRRMCLPGGMDASEIESIDQILPISQQTTIFPYSLPHMGIVVTGIRKSGLFVVDAEFTKAVLDAGGVAGVKTWLASLA